MASMSGIQGINSAFGVTNILPQTTSNLWDQYSRTSNTQGSFSTAANAAALNSNYGLTGTNSYQQMMLMQQMMGMGYGGMSSQMYLSPTSTLTITNTCAYDVDVQVGANAQIMVSPNTSNISIKGNTQVTIMSNSLPGVYNVNILAGYNGNLSPFVTIPVNVIDYASETVQDDCFKVEGEPTIDMSSFTKQHKQLKVYNYCFSKGIVFDDANPIALMGLFASEDVYQTVNGKQVKVMSKDDEYATIKVIKSPQIETSNTYGRYQYIELMIIKNNAIQNVSYDNYVGTDTLSNTAQSLSVLRGAATALENNVNFKALMRINARIGYGMAAQQKQIIKNLTIRDLWNLLALAGAGEITAGNKNCLPKDWDAKIEKELNYTLKYSQVKNRIPLNNESWDLLASDCFGSYDDVKFKDDYLEETSNGITVKLIPHFKDRKLYFDIDVKGSGKEFKGTYDFGYTLKSYWHSEAPLQQKDRSIKINLTITDVNAGSSSSSGSNTSSTTNDTFCSDKFGSEWMSLKSYGLGSLENLSNMLNFDYRTNTTVDCSKIFCDAEQLKKYLQNSFSSSTKPTTFEDFKGTKYLVKSSSDKTLVELLPSKVLDSLSMYFLDKYLTELISNTNIESEGFAKFKDLVKDMPNLFLVANACDPTAGAYSFSNVGNTKCYYNAKKMSIDSTSETVMRNIFKDQFELVFLIPETKWELAGFMDNSTIKTKIVFLKPDNYKEYFEKSNFLSYKANVTGDVKEPGAYLVYMNLNGSDKELKIFDAEKFVDQTYKANTVDKFFYSLAIDPTRDGFTNYSGEFGLCNKQTSNELLPIAQVYSCSSTNKNINEFKFSNNKYLEINYTNYDYIVNFPNACRLNSTCEINGNNNFKVIAPKNAYTLENIFNTPQNYCYSESNNIVKVIYSGEQKVN
jgi:hypothetical protein